jgi:hypothetical protein
MAWTVVLAGPARKSLKRIPAWDKTRILFEVVLERRQVAIAAIERRTSTTLD